MTKSNSNIRGILLALAGFAVFAIHDALVKVLGDYSIFQIIFFAMLFAYVPFSLAIVSNKRPQSFKPNNLGLVILRSALTVAALCFAFLSFSSIPLVETYFLLFCTPLLISLLAIIFLGESIALTRWIAILLGLVGVLVVLRPSPETAELGHLFGLCASFCSAGAAITSRKIGQLENAATLMIFPIIANILVTGSLLYFVYKPMALIDLSLMFLIGTFGLVGQLLVLLAYRSTPAALIAPAQYSQIIWAIIIGSLFFSETIDKFVIIGSLITVSSGLLIFWREARASTIKPNLRSKNTRMSVVRLTHID